MRERIQHTLFTMFSGHFFGKGPFLALFLLYHFGSFTLDALREQAFFKGPQGYQPPSAPSKQWGVRQDFPKRPMEWMGFDAEEINWTTAMNFYLKS